MAVEYDLVIIGGSQAGIDTALTAASLKARVALVMDRPVDGADWFRRSLAEIAQAHQATQSFSRPTAQDITTSTHDTQDVAAQHLATVIATLEEQQSPAVLSAAGIEVIWGTGQFDRKKQLVFSVGGRSLTARAFLVATGTCPVIPAIPGLKETDYLTAESLARPWLSSRSNAGVIASAPLIPAKDLVIIGGDPTGIEFAQIYTRLGVRVTLIVQAAHILAREDREAAELIQAHLEAEGVRVLTQTAVTQVKQIQDKKWVQAEATLMDTLTGQESKLFEAIEADEILIAAGQDLNVETLNLEAVGVRRDRQGLRLNNWLQTTHPQIYICGAQASYYTYPYAMADEARIALKNALFLPLHRLKKRGIPRSVLTTPQLATVGLTEAQAQRQYGQDLLVLRHYFKTLTKAHIQGQASGFCKILVRQNGEILGAHLVGVEASEWISTIALAMQQHLTISALATLPPITPSFSEIIQRTAADWQNQRRYQSVRQDILENFFAWRRSHSR